MMIVKKLLFVIPIQEKYNFAIITEHCCDDTAAEFEASLKNMDFIQNYEVSVRGRILFYFDFLSMDF